MTPTDLAILKSLLDRSIPKVVNGDKGDKGDSIKGDKGDSVKGDKGDSIKGDKGDSVKGDKGDSIKGDKGDSVKGDKGDSVKGDKGDTVKGDKGDSVKGDKGDFVKGDKGDDGRGIKSISVNDQDMLVVTYDDGDLTIAGKVHFTKQSNGGDYYTGAPLGTFGIKGTKTSAAGELIIVGPWGKEFNTGFTGGGGATNDWIKLTTSFSSIPTFNTALLGGSVYNYSYNNDTLTLFRYIAAGGSDRYFQTFNGTTLDGLVATKAQTITL